MAALRSPPSVTGSYLFMKQSIYSVRLPVASLLPLKGTTLPPGISTITLVFFWWPMDLLYITVGWYLLSHPQADCEGTNGRFLICPRRLLILGFWEAAAILILSPGFSLIVDRCQPERTALPSHVLMCIYI